MGFQYSPGVKDYEIDLTGVVTGVATTGAVLAGPFQWGPALERTLTDSEEELVKKFGKPDTDTATTFLTASSFLAYGNNLNVVRCLSTAARNASVKGDAISRIIITNAGVGYTQVPTLAISGGSGTGATATCTVADGKIATVTVTAGGTGFKSSDTITIGITPGNGDTPSTPAVLTAFVGVVIKNTTDYDNNYAAGQGAVGEFAARYAGDFGNTLKVSMADSASFATWDYKGEFDGTPGTSDYATAVGGSNDELHVVVVDTVSGDVLERYAYVSKASDAKTAQGESNYYANVISRSSQYIYWMDHPAAGTKWGSKAAAVSFDTLTEAYTKTLAGGVDGNDTLTDGEIEAGYDLFNTDDFEFNLILTAGHSATVCKYVVDNIAEVRQDCVAILSPPKTAVVNNLGKELTDVVKYRTTDLNINSSFAMMNCNWIKKYDKYNDVYWWVPDNGDVAGLIVRTDNVRDPWFSPAGLNRGQLKGVRALAWNPKEAYRDQLYQAQINPIVSFPGQGAVLWGDKTMQAKPSAFSQINVRRLFIVLRKAVKNAAKYVLFELNDEVTRGQFRALIDPFLRDVQGRRGIYEYKVVCDGSNNTQQVIDTNGFRGDIYVQPARSINFITLNFVATRTNVSFSESVGKF
jgi:hypothetical protein